MTPEGKIQSAILKAFKSAGILVFRNNTGHLGRVTFGLGVGSADLIAILPPRGHVLAIEVKCPGKKPTEEQLRWGKLLSQHGGCYEVVTSVDEAFGALLRARRKLGNAA